MSVYKARLLKLADFLDKLPTDRFNINTFVGPDWKGKTDLSCGTTACMFGWATTMPEFQELGLRLHFNATHLAAFVVGSDYPLDGDFPTYSDSVSTGKQIFNLDEDEFNFLFLPIDQGDDEIEIGERSQLSPKATSQDAAQHLRHFVMHKYGNLNLEEV